ncbi:MAG: DUF4124 domain-containing protein [Methylotenera sp.]|nr:DUF4124 domain-containing protein [Methylotenera sp.]
MVKLQTNIIDYSINHTKNGLTILVLLLLAHLLTFSHHASAGKIVKWKDDQGVTHYGDRVPTQYANRESSELNKQGVMVKQHKPANPQAQAFDIAKVEQDKKDKALLNTFTNAEEIDLARDRNLQLDLVAVEGLQVQKKTSLKRLATSQSYADSLAKKKKPVPADLNAEIKANQAEVDKQEQQISERKAIMEKTRKRFDDDKARFIMLKNIASGGGATAEVKPLVSPTTVAPITSEPVKAPANGANTSKR